MNVEQLFFSAPGQNWFFLTCVIRILLAVVCGGVIGIERSHRQKGAGIRTHIIIALGAAVMMIVSKYGFYDVLKDGLSADPSRIASNIMTGMGFIGAGVIFVKNTSIKGLTTAAGLWATSGVAMAIGAGLYTVGIFTTGVMLALQILLHLCLKSLDTSFYSELTITIRHEEGALERLKEQLVHYHAMIEGYRFKREGETETVRITVKVSSKVPMDELFAIAETNQDVLTLEI
ncbi:MAG: MgtC/SapB family protein [Clostridiales bacterium]|nr:MgtC/SapB family protein [Clostridiales bacterium]